MASRQAEVRELVGEIRRRGFDVFVGGKHAKIYHRGVAVQDPDTGVPLTLPTTPSDARWRENTVRHLVRARVLEGDPKKMEQQPQTEGRKKASVMHTAEARETALRRARERAEKDRQDTVVLRGRLEKLFKPLGVWREAGMGAHGWKGTISEIARVAYYWAQANDIPGLASEHRAREAVRAIYRGDGAVRQAREPLSQFCDMLEKGGDVRATYQALRANMVDSGHVRSEKPQTEEEPMQQLAQTNGAVEAAEPTDDTEEAVQETPKEIVAAFRRSSTVETTDGKPHVALRALAMMARAANDETAVDRAISIAEEILTLEGR